MNHLTMKSTDLTQVNIDKIAELFPNVITEARDGQGKIKRAVDFDLLKQELSDVLVEGEKERYQLTWPGKKEAIINANTSIDRTLRPVKKDSVDWDNTQNLYLEGDNLETLKLLQESYLNKIKMIYIDPPYNTGSDFIYKDNFTESVEEYLEESGQVDEDGKRLFLNTETNGRFHSDWLTMMYSRLKIARYLLKEDGVIFISIDDNEVENMVTICKEIFGRDNFEGIITWRRRHNQPNDGSKMIAKVSEHIVVFSKNTKTLKERSTFYGVPLSKERIEDYTNPDQDPNGPWTTNPWKAAVGRGGSTYSITTPTGKQYHETWYGNKETFDRLLAEKRVHWTDKGNGLPRIKLYLKEAMKKGQPAINFFGHQEYGSNQDASNELQNLFSGKAGMFDNPKPTKLIKALIKIATSEEDIILDFFSGTAATADAVMQINAEDEGQGKRKFIMVQLPEETDQKSEAYKNGYTNICEIGKERIRRAAKKIKEETGADIDYGFRVYRVDSSNMKDVYYTPDRLGQMNLDDMASNIKEDRTVEDLLIQVILECGLELSLPMESREIEGKTVHYVAGNSLIACFDDEVSESVIKKMAEDQPLRLVFRDSSFRDDSARINVEELFKLLSPSTEIQVL